jgi:ribosomal protein L40E
MASAEHNEMNDSQAKQDTPLCPHCLAENDPKAHFCYKCGTPMSYHATVDPIASIWARGDTWRKAVSRPTRPITLVGMWLLFGVSSLLLLHAMFFAGSLEGIVSLEGFITVGLCTAMIVLYGCILVKTTKTTIG